MTERRRFNSGERVALYLAADGCCQMCGIELEPGWHGDHVQPHSRDGITDVINGQALCPQCNLRKGDIVTELRRWQADALQTLRMRGADFLCVATPGAGKTTFALTAAQRLIESGESDRLVVVVPTAHLRGQWAAAAAGIGIQLDHRFVNGNAVIAKDFDGVAVTYAAVASAPVLWRKLAAGRRTAVVLDEVHHAGEDDNLTWGPALKTAFEPAVRRLLLSGTPFRSDRKAIPFVRYEGDRAVPDYNYDYGQALMDREVVRPIEFAALDGNVRWRSAGLVVSTDLADADEESVARALNFALDPAGDWVPSVLRRADEELTRQRGEVPDAGGLVVAADQARAEAYARLLARITGEEPTVAISDRPDASELIHSYAKSTTRWIVAVQMVSEGVDIPRLAVGVYASRYKTEMFFRQVVGRFVRMRGVDDTTTATLFIPSIQPLLSHAHRIEKTVEDALVETERQMRQEIAENSEQIALQFDLVEPLDSSEAVHHSTILSGESFTDEELRRALTAAQTYGLPSNVTAAQVARLLRGVGAGRVVGTATVQAPSAPAGKPLADEKQKLRQLIARKVGRIHRMTDTPHSHIHNKLNQLCGDKPATATAETLNRRLELLDEWEARRG